MKASKVPDKLPMRGNRKVGKNIRLAESIGRPEYFQHQINSLTKDTTHGSQEESQAEELTVVDSPLPIRQEKGKQSRKAITGKGLLD